MQLQYLKKRIAKAETAGCSEFKEKRTPLTFFPSFHQIRSWKVLVKRICAALAEIFSCIIELAHVIFLAILTIAVLRQTVEQ